MKNRCWEKYACWFVVLALFLVVGALAPQIQNRVWAQGQGKFLADRHQGRGANCAACHKESPPKDVASSEACVKCHGNMEKVAVKTVKAKPLNPHDSHLGEIACNQCHKGHKAPVNACAQCHPFEFKVP
jgi:hypothetical protein